jgi:hypothetical protein
MRSFNIYHATHAELVAAQQGPTLVYGHLPWFQAERTGFLREVADGDVIAGL